LAQAIAAFGKYLECVLRTIAHRLEYLLNKFERNIAMKKIAH
jgi:hypothetical protein